MMQPIVALLLLATLISTNILHILGNRCKYYSIKNRGTLRMNANDDSTLLVRALRGEETERTPVWLMRQVRSSSLQVMSIKNVELNVGGQIHGRFS